MLVGLLLDLGVSAAESTRRRERRLLIVALRRRLQVQALLLVRPALQLVILSLGLVESLRAGVVVVVGSRSRPSEERGKVRRFRSVCAFSRHVSRQREARGTRRDNRIMYTEVQGQGDTNFCLGLILSPPLALEICTKKAFVWRAGLRVQGPGGCKRVKCYASRGMCVRACGCNAVLYSVKHKGKLEDKT